MFHLFGRNGKKNSNNSTKRLRTRRIQLESLEDRCLLAVMAGSIPMPVEAGSTWIVTTIKDTVNSGDGVLSLREAIASAQDGDTITFDSSLATKTITLSASLKYETTFTIAKSITITGNGVTVSGNNYFRVMNVTAEGVSISNVNFTKGNSSDSTLYPDNNYGGAIYVADGASLSIYGGTFSNNVAGGGGAIYNAGTLMIYGSDFTGNGGSGCPWGPAIYNVEVGTLSINVSDDYYSSVFDNNTGSYCSGAIYSLAPFAVNNTTFSNNDTGMKGGAIWVTGEGVSTIKNCLFVNNHANNQGGALYTENGAVVNMSFSTMAGNTVGNGYGDGAGIMAFASMTIDGCVILNQRASEIYACGGGVDIAISNSCFDAANTKTLINATITETGTNHYYSADGVYFADEAGGDYTLDSRSALLNQGGATRSGLAWDLAENPGVYGPAADVGCYEYQGDPSFLFTVTGYTGQADGSGHGVTVSDTLEGDVIYYSANQTNWVTTPITYSAIGTYTIYVKVQRTGYADSINSGVVELKSNPPETPSTVVTTFEDVVDAFDYEISFREALTIYAVDGDTISFAADLAGTMTLTEAFEITKNVTVAGNENITISGKSATQLFIVNANVTFDSLNLTAGKLTASDSLGGGVYVVAGKSLEMFNTIFTSCGATYGGALANDGTVTMYGGRFESNTGSGGAAIYNTGTMKIYGTDFIKNGDGGTPWGSAIYNLATGSLSINDSADMFYSSVFSENYSSYCGTIYSFAAVQIYNVTFTGNYSGVWGGAVSLGGNNGGDGAVSNIVNCLMVNNKSNSQGGAIRNNSGFPVNLSHSTLVGNIAGEGAGILAFATTTIDSCVFLDKTANEIYACGNGVDIAISNTYYDPTMTKTLINGTITEVGTNYHYAEGDLLFTNAAEGNYTPIDGGILVNHGAFTRDGLAWDLAGNQGVVGPKSDIGAYENQTKVTEEPSNVVTTLLDVVDPEDGVISLREAITVYAQDGDTVSFIEGLAGTITLSSIITITQSVSITGNDAVTVSGGDVVSLFSVTAGTADFSDLVLTHAKGGDTGGALNVAAGTMVTLTDVDFLLNSANYGGAINNAGTLEIYGGDFDSNAAGGGGAINNTGSLSIFGADFYRNGGSGCPWGPAIYHQSGTLEINNSTDVFYSSLFDANVGSYCSGAIYALAPMTIYNASFTGNTAGVHGGAIWVKNAGTTVIGNTLFANNKAQQQGGAVYAADGAFVQFDYCSFAGNRGGDGAAIMAFTSVSVSNSVFFDQVEKELYACGNGVNISLSNTYYNPANTMVLINGTITEVGTNYHYTEGDYIFADEAAGDYTLDSRSLLINKGTDSRCGMLSDLAGNAAIYGPAADLGSFEYQSDPSFIFTVTGYRGQADGAAHGVVVSGLIEGDSVYYSVDNQTWGDEPLTYTEVGTYTVYVKVERAGYADAFNSGVVELITVPAEDPSTVVTTLNDVVDAFDGVISLREAITVYAQDGDTVSFIEGLAGTITLSSIITITQSVSITGNDAVTVSGGDVVSLFSVTAGATDFSDLVLTHAKGGDTGGALNVAAGTMVTLTDVDFLLNSANYGGAINNAGTLEIYGGDFDSNAAGGGGAINNTGSLSIFGADFYRNGGSGCPWGPAIYHQSGTLEINNSTDVFYSSLFDANVGSYCSGAIYALAPMTIYNASFTGNTAGVHGGAIWVKNAGTTVIGNTLFANNKANQQGGAVYAADGAFVQFDYCSFAGNRGGDGAAIMAFTSVSVSNSVFFDQVEKELYACGNGVNISLSNTYYNPANTMVLINGTITEVGTNYHYTEGDDVFADETAGDYTPADGSVLLDKGTDSRCGMLHDLAGNSPVVRAAADLGAFENQNAVIVTPLAAPSNVVVTSFGANRVTVSWDVVENAVGYTIAYSTDQNVWTEVASANSSAVVTGLTYGAVTYYQVKALGDGVNFSDSEFSAAVDQIVCPMDVDGDGRIGPSDRTFLSTAWMSSSAKENWNAACDIDGNGMVAPADRNFMSANWLKASTSADLQYPPALADVIMEDVGLDAGIEDDFGAVLDVDLDFIV